MALNSSLNPARAADLIAGVSIAGLLLPEAVAYSGIANLPPQAGVIALFAGLLGYALVGKSRFAIVSATSSSAAVVAATTSALAEGDASLRVALAAGFVLLAGIVFILASLARLGSATDFIAKPVLRGFAFGLAIVIIVKQLPILFGVSSAGGDVWHVVMQLSTQMRQFNLYDLSIGVAALVLLFACSRFRKVPGALLSIALGIAAIEWTSLAAHGVTLVGAISLDSVHLALPMLTEGKWAQLAQVSVALALVLYSETSGSIRNFALKYGDPVLPNRDLLALGVGNILSGLFQGMPVGAGFSATSANESAGAQSRVASLVAAGTIFLLIITVLPWLAKTPAAILAAIVIHAVSHALNPLVFKPYFLWKRDRSVAVLAVLAVLGLGVLNGLLAAVGISIAMMLRGLSNAHVAVLGRHANGHDFVDCERDPEAATISTVLVLRPNAPLFFANVDRIFVNVRQDFMAALAKTPIVAEDLVPTEALQSTPSATERTLPKVALTVVLSLEETPDVDGTTLEALATLAADIARFNGRLLLARAKQPVLDALMKAAIPQLTPETVSFYSVDDAVTAAVGELTPPPTLH